MSKAISSNGNRLAKNTILMYGRMVVLILVSIYTSRVLLSALGVEDFGIYNLVGSVIAIFQSFRTMFASATQRFLNIEMGRCNFDKLQKVFSMSLLVNILVAIVFAVLAETIGVWFIENKINIDPSKISDAYIVLHFSVAAAIIGIMTTSYDAVIIANERMSFFAYSSIIETLLKLIIVFPLFLFDDSRIVWYAFLVFIVSIIIRFINSIYCHRHFKESNFIFYWDRSYFNNMLSFAGWQLFGNTSSALSNNCLNMVLNVFGGPIVNAARGIAYQVNSLIQQFIINISIVINPFCIKTYGEGNIEKLNKLLFFSSKIYFIIETCIVIPMFMFTKEILKIWLGVVPKYTVEYVQMILLWSIVKTFHPSIDTYFKAVGKLKIYQISEGIIFMLPLLCSYITLKMGGSLILPFVYIVLFEVIDLIVIIVEAKYCAQFNLQSFMKLVLFPIAIVFVVFSCFTFGIYIFVGDILYRIMAVILLDIVFVITSYIVLLSKIEKQLMSDFILTKVHIRR